MDEFLQISIALLIIGIASLVYGIFKIRLLRKLLKNGVKTDAIIESVRQDSVEEKNIYFITIKFTDSKNNIIQYTPTEGVSGFEKKSGDLIKILYDPNDPYTVIFRESPMSLIPYIALIVGFLLSFSSMGLMIYLST